MAMAGAGIGIGTIFGGLLIAISRQPWLEQQLFSYAILGFALTEAIALFALMMAFLLLFGCAYKINLFFVRLTYFLK